MAKATTADQITKLAIIALLLTAGVCAYLAIPKHKIDADKYRETVVARDDFKLTVLATGMVLPQNRLEIKPPVAGRIETILVNEGQNVKAGQTLAWMSSAERAALLDAARAKGPKEVAHWKALYRAIPVVAPLDATVIARDIEPGQTVAMTDTLFATSDRLIIKAQVDETDIAKIKVGQNAEITLDAYPKEAIPARVDHIAFEAKTVNSVTMYEVEIVPLKIPAYMRSGMTATATFVLSSKRDVLLVDSEAVKEEDGRTFVRVPAPSAGEKPVLQEVQLGLTDGRKAEIIAGLKEGDIVLIKDRSKSKKKKEKSPFVSMNNGATPK